VEDRGCLVDVGGREPGAGFRGGEQEQLDPPAAGFLDHIRRNRQSAFGARTDDQPMAAPGQRLGGRERSVTVPVALRLRGLLVTGRDPASLDKDIAIVGLTVELDESESNEASFHRGLSMLLSSHPSHATG